MLERCFILRHLVTLLILPSVKSGPPNSMPSGGMRSRRQSRTRHTLFITAAGNSDSNNGFVDDVPSSLHLPNPIAVGAVNQAGDETSFTSYGDTVVVDADGYNVESYVPGGARLKLSGTSMASPNVVNLAAKLFALDPSLTPAQVIDLIKRGATASEDGRRHLIDEKRTVALLQAQSKK
jgi:subtilisin family serine protease